jgi:hypothetical protein
MAELLVYDLTAGKLYLPWYSWLVVLVLVAAVVWRVTR